MGRIENFKQYAADCMRQAEGEESIQDKNILLNVALAWVRLAQQASGETVATSDEGFEDAASADSDLLLTDSETDLESELETDMDTDLETDLDPGAEDKPPTVQ